MRTCQALYAIVAVAVAAFVGVSGCSFGPNDDEPIGTRLDAILYGSEDTTHQSVMALMNNDGGRPGWCTATLIAKKGDRGFLLTAAHCVVNRYNEVSQPKYLRVHVGDDKYSSTAVYFVERVAIHPLYDAVNARDSEVANDFAMLEVSGVDSSLIPIPAMTPAEDNLVAGDKVEIVGYGFTEAGDNTRRRHIVRPITTVVDPWFHYDQAGTVGGICNADSGGPALTTTGTPVVAAISAFAEHSKEQKCMHGFSERVSIVYDSFIQPFIDGEPRSLSGKKQLAEDRQIANGRLSFGHGKTLPALQYQPAATAAPRPSRLAA